YRTLPSPLTTTAALHDALPSFSFTAANKVYDGNTGASISSSSRAASDLVGSDVATLDDSHATASFADKNAGLGKTVTATGFALTVGSAHNCRPVTSPLTTPAYA